MNRADFFRWFNNDFWKAFRRLTIPISIPRTSSERAALLERVYSSIESARYSPGIPEIEIVMNKGHGVARTVPVFCIEDYCVYYFCIKELEDVLCVNRTENTFGGWTLGGQLRKAEYVEVESEQSPYGRYSFNPSAWMYAFGEFNALLFAQLEQRHFSNVLQFDLTNFYDCVRLDILERWIREEASSDKGWIIALLFYLLNQWNRRNTGLHPQSVGLPQDALADCSRILANYYLQKYDQFAARICGSMGGMYFRYADDQIVLLNDVSDVEKLLLLLTRRLDRYGLRVNQKKVQMWTADQLEEHRCRKIQSIFANKEDSKNPELVLRFVGEYLKLTPQDLERSWNGGMPLLNRLIWAALETLPPHLFEVVVQRLTADEYLLTANWEKLRRVKQLNDKRLMPPDLPASLRRLCEHSVHNTFHYEALAFARAEKLPDLETFAQERIRALDEMMDSENW